MRFDALVRPRVATRIRLGFGFVLLLLASFGGLLYVGLITTKEAEYLGLFITAWTGYALRDAIKNLK